MCNAFSYTPVKFVNSTWMYMDFLLLKIKPRKYKFDFSNLQIDNHDPKLCPVSDLEKYQEIWSESDD